MKVLHISTSDSVGGAARAAYRLHKALNEIGVDSVMRVLYSNTADPQVISGIPSLSQRLLTKWQHYKQVRSTSGWSSDNQTLFSFGNVGAGLVPEINGSDADVVNLHWIPGILSIPDIGRLKKPLVWRLADMWAFCGGEHSTVDLPTERFRQGYTTDNCPISERGLDLNRKAWEAKRRAWRRQHFDIVCTTRWLARCARESVLLGHLPIHIIPNALDTDSIWAPIPKEAARLALRLPLGKKLILMGAVGGLGIPIKGGDLFREVVERVVSHRDDIAVVIYGQPPPKTDDRWPCPIYWLGEVRDDRILVLANSAVDVKVTPSRQEPFGQTASEAQACGTPVVAFGNSGLADIVIHRETGWLANAFDTEDMAEGLLWILSDEVRRQALSQLARAKAIERFSSSVVAYQYAKVYENVCEYARRRVGYKT